MDSAIITGVSALLSQITAYREKKHRVALTSSTLPLLFAFNHQIYTRYLTTNRVELTNVPSKNSSAYKDLQT